MTADILNSKNQKIADIDLPDNIFAAKWSPDLVHQVVLAQLANSRSPWAHTKGRGDVSGGGKKPRKQKGTGQSRQGSIRSPLWAGGGITFGPNKERNYTQAINDKMRRLAVFDVLSKKISDNEFRIYDSFDEASMKEMRTEAKSKDFKKALLIISTANKDLRKVIANSEKISAISPKSLNAYDLLNCKNIFAEKSAIEEIKNHYAI